MGPEGKAAFEAWLEALKQRHQSDLTFAEIRRAVQALSARYVGGRNRLGEAFAGAGKRAAYAMYFAPLHFLTVGHIVRETRLAKRGPGKLLDLGCGTGVGGAAWAVEGLFYCAGSQRGCQARNQDESEHARIKRKAHATTLAS